MILRHLFLLLSLLITSSSFAQNNNKNIEWRASNHYLNEQYDEAILECTEILSPEVHSTDLVFQRTQLILARSFMQTGEYEYALEVLRETKIDAEFFGIGVEGMMGDCRSQQGKYEAALRHYKKVIKADANEVITPYYLFKAYLCSKELNRPIEANRYIQTVLEYFPSYSGQNVLYKYLTIDTVTSIQLRFPEVKQPEKLGIGTVNGVPVSDKDYFYAVRIARENAKQQAQQAGQLPQDIDPDRVWDAFVEEKTLYREYDRLHLSTDDEELMAYLLGTDGYRILPEFLQSYAFTDEDGNFSAAILLARIDEMRYSEEESVQKAWENTEAYYRHQLLQEKYFNLLGLIPFPTDLEIQMEQNEAKTYEARIFCERFRDVSEDEITITDQELRAYYEKNKSKSKYQINKDQREVLLLREPIAPTKADTVFAYKKAKKLKKMFRKAKDDYSFVVRHSDLNIYTSGPYSTGVPADHERSVEGKYITYPVSLSEKMETVKIGKIVGPYVHNDQVTLAKIIGRTDEVINARHILLQVHGEPDDPTYEEAQEFFRTVTNENFDSLARSRSEDLGSADRGGDLGDFFFGDMVPTFATFCANAPVGEIGFVQTQYGYHVVQVTKRSGKTLPRLALVTFPLELSEESYSSVTNQLEEFITEYKSQIDKSDKQLVSEIADSIAESQGTFLRPITIRDHAPRLNGFVTQQAEDNVYRFAYDTGNSAGTISAIYKDSLNFCVLIHTGTEEKGIPSFEHVRDHMYSDLLNDKKAEILKSSIQSSDHSQVEEKVISLSQNVIKGYGYEPMVIGRAIDAFHSKDETTIFRGNSGVFYAKVSEELNDTDIPSEKSLFTGLSSSVKYHLPHYAKIALREINQVIDNRTLHRLGIRL